MFNSLFLLDLFNSFIPILDVFLVSIIFYGLYRLLYSFKSVVVINFIIFSLLIYSIVVLLELNAVLWILKSVIGWVIIGSIVIFHPELRALISHINYRSIFPSKIVSKELPDMYEVSKALYSLIQIKRGALIIFSRNMNLNSIITTHITLDAKISSEIIETIFSYDTPLHDGAILIENTRIRHAGCYLPMERDVTLPSDLGSRHRAAVALTKNSDAVVLVLSEQYGVVSLAFEGELLYDIGVEKARLYTIYLLQNQSINASWMEDLSLPLR